MVGEEIAGCGAHSDCQAEEADVLRQNFANISGNVMGMRQLEGEQKRMLQTRVQEKEEM